VDVYEKDGVTWIGRHGLRFEGTGKEVRACAAGSCLSVQRRTFS
jgi:hypothetical protein